jgi:nitrate reductase gamma subunit
MAVCARYRKSRPRGGHTPRPATVTTHMSIACVLTVWLLLAVAMSANGIFRELALRPAVGAVTADILSAILGIAIITAITGWLLRARVRQPIRHLVRVSALLVGLTVAFEFLFGHYVDRKSWSELAANYAFWRGRLWPLVLAALALMPFLWGRWVTR